METNEELFRYDSYLDVSPKRHLILDRRLSPETLEFSLEAIDFILNALPHINCREENGIVTVGGFWAKDLNKDTEKSWGSRRISNSIFLELNSRSLKFYSFFVIEVLYILDELKRRGSSVSHSTLDGLAKNIYENTWLKNANMQPPKYFNFNNIKRRMNASPLGMQEEFIVSYATNAPKLNLNGTIIAAPPGRGKTLAGLFTGEAMDFDAMFFIVPNAAVDTVWEKTVKWAYKKPQPYWTSHQNTNPTGRERIIICHYEGLDKAVAIAHKYANKKVLIWLDESHNFNTDDSMRTQRFIKLVELTRSQDVIWASATPLKAIGSEAVPVLKTIDRLFTSEVQKAFVGIYGSTKGRALDIFAHRLSKIIYKPTDAMPTITESEDYTIKVRPPQWRDFTLDAIRAKVRDFVEERIGYYTDEMPKITAEVHRILDYVAEEIPARDGRGVRLVQYRKYIKDMHDHFDFVRHKEIIPICKETEKIIEPLIKKEDLKIFRKYISVYKYVVLVIRGEALGLIVTKMRIEAIKSLIPLVPWKSIIDEAEKKVLVFSNYINVADEASSFVEDLGFSPVTFHSQMNTDFTQVKEKIVHDAKANPLFTTYKSVREAVELIECNVEIFLDLPFRDYVFTQARGRIDRVGQDAKRHYITILMDTGQAKNITERSLDIMEWSREMVNSMMGIDVEEEISLESIDIGAPDEWPEDAEMEPLSKKDVWYRNTFDIPKSYF